jgi:hypothetical protein
MFSVRARQVEDAVSDRPQNHDGNEGEDEAPRSHRVTQLVRRSLAERQLLAALDSRMPIPIAEEPRRGCWNGTAGRGSLALIVCSSPGGGSNGSHTVQPTRRYGTGHTPPDEAHARHQSGLRVHSLHTEPIGICEGAGCVKRCSGARGRGRVGGCGSGSLFGGFRTRVSCCVMLGCQASVRAVRSAWCGRATTRKGSIS